MYADLDKKRANVKKNGEKYRANKAEAIRSVREENIRRIAAAILAAEMMQESNG